MAGAFANEGEYKAAWQSLDDGSLPSLAMRGGEIADCLSYVFCAAYQCAVRQCFAGLERGLWYCFAASEDRSGTLPRVTLSGESISGSKTWIAAASAVDKLIVTTDDGIVLVDRDASSVEIDPSDRKSFLPELVQGRAHFSETPIESRLTMTGDFGLAEAFYVTCASAAYLKRWGDNDDLAAAITSLSSINPDEPDINTLLAAHDTIKSHGKAIAAAENDSRLKNDFEANGRLLGMYGRALRDRS